MGSLDELLAVHKKTVLIGGNGFSVDCYLKTPGGEKFDLKGLSSFIGITFEDNNIGHFGDSFELTIDINDLKEQSNLIPTRAWSVGVKFPQMNMQNGKENPTTTDKSDFVNFKIENVAIDRTIGIYLIKCSADGSYGGMKVKRQASGGM